MKKFNYFKRVENGKVVDLHIHEHKGEEVLSKIYPTPQKDSYYKIEEFEELDNVDDWLDVGLEVGIFDTKPIPNNIKG